MEADTVNKNVFIRADIALSALETFCSMGYISLLIYLLTYLLTVSGPILVVDAAGSGAPEQLRLGIQLKSVGVHPAVHLNACRQTLRYGPV